MSTAAPVLTSQNWVSPVTGRRMFLVEDGRGNLRANEIPTEAELTEFYTNHFERTSYQRRGKALQGWHRAWRVRRFSAGAESPRMLDFGFGNGQFLRACRRRFPHAELVGFEMSESQCRLAREEAGADAFSNWAELEAKYPDGFDLITAWHVLEHAPDPGSTIRQLYAALKPGGSCILAVPNRDAWGMKLRREEWAWCQAPYVHIWQFSPDGIERLLRENAARVEVSLTTRDAWDCNFLVDAALTSLGPWRRLQPASVRLRAESVFRLMATVVNEAFLNPVIFTHSLRGSELIVRLTKPRAG